MFKMLEMYEGKITIDVNSLSNVGRQYMIQFKEELNKVIAEKMKSNTKNRDTRTNAEIHRSNIGGR